MRTEAKESLPEVVLDTLRKLGGDIRTARKRRGLTAKDLATRARVTRPTLAKLEKGEPGVSLGILTHVLWVLELDYRVGELVDPGEDAMGTAITVRSLPERVRGHNRRTSDDSKYDF
jgi:transcriptional regulator with XRE-family HTH domain